MIPSHDIGNPFHIALFRSGNLDILPPQLNLFDAAPDAFSEFKKLILIVIYLADTKGGLVSLRNIVFVSFYSH
jgi:hypothetical protein